MPTPGACLFPDERSGGKIQWLLQVPLKQFWYSHGYAVEIMWWGYPNSLPSCLFDINLVWRQICAHSVHMKCAFCDWFVSIMLVTSFNLIDRTKQSKPLSTWGAKNIHSNLSWHLAFRVSQLPVRFQFAHSKRMWDEIFKYVLFLNVL
jgi:hypothetical protein